MNTKPLGRPRSSALDRKRDIGEAASRLFAEIGYEKATIRLIAEAASVDPKLVMHYFGNKHKLFIATVQVPAEVGSALSILNTMPKENWGVGVTEIVWKAQQSGALQTLVGVIRASASEPEAAEMFRDFYFKNLLMPMVSSLPVDNREVRAMMLTSVMSGFVFTSDIVHLYEKSEASPEERKSLMSNVIQTILTSPI